MQAVYKQKGDSIDYIPTSDVAAGDIVILNGDTDFVGVAKLDIKAGELGAIALIGIYEVLIHEISNSITVGEKVKVYSDTGAVINNTSSDPGTFFGYAVTAGAPNESILVLLAHE